MLHRDVVPELVRVRVGQATRTDPRPARVPADRPEAEDAGVAREGVDVVGVRAQVDAGGRGLGIGRIGPGVRIARRRRRLAVADRVRAVDVTRERDVAVGRLLVEAGDRLAVCEHRAVDRRGHALHCRIAEVDHEDERLLVAADRGFRLGEHLDAVVRHVDLPILALPVDRDERPGA